MPFSFSALKQQLLTVDNTMKDLTRHLSSFSAPALSSFQQNDDLKAIKSRLIFLENGTIFSSFSVPFPPFDDTTALSLRMYDIVEELKLIESRMRGEGFVIVDNDFLSSLNTETWVAIHFKKGHYEYIVDAVSLFSFIPQSENKHSNDDLDEKSKATKLGLTSAQGKVFISLHNVLPAIFGSKDSDVLHLFPSLKTRDKWWSRDGTAGVNSVLRDNL